MSRIALALGLTLLASGACAQGCGPTNPNCIVPTPPPGDSSNKAASTAWVLANAPGGGGSNIGGVPALGWVPVGINSTSSAWSGSYFPGLTLNVNGSGVPGLDLPTCSGPTNCGWRIYQQPGTGDAARTAALTLHRQSTYTGTGSAPFGTTVQSLFALTFTSPNGALFEWPITSQMINQTLGTTMAQNVAINGTAQKINAPGSPGEIGPTWGGNFACLDSTGVVDPMHSCIGTEIDVSAAPGAGSDVFRQRVGLQIAWAPNFGGDGTGLHFGQAILLGGCCNATMDHAILFAGGPSGPYQIGINFANAAFSKAPLFLAASQRIALDGTGADLTTVGNFTRSIYVNSGFFVYETPMGAVFNISDQGYIFTGGISMANAAPPATAGVGYGGTTTTAAPCPTGTVGGQIVRGCTIINVSGTQRYQPFF